MGAGIAGISPECAISAIVATEIRKRKKDFAGVRDRSGLEALFGSSCRGKKVRQLAVAARNQFEPGFARNRLARANVAQGVACSGSEDGRRHVASNDTTPRRGNVGGCLKRRRNVVG